MLENAHFEAQHSPNCIWRPGSARTRWGSLQHSPRPLISTIKGGGGRWELKRVGKERNHTKQRKKRDQGKGRETWNNGVCPVLWKYVVGNHIDLPPYKCLGPPSASPLEKAGAATGAQVLSHFNFMQKFRFQYQLRVRV